MNKHTPGPWDWRNIDALWTSDDGRYGEPVLCASYDSDRGAHLKTTDANRNLICAAPDMLSALEAIAPMLPHGAVDSDPQWAAAINAVRAAIKKARGDE
jgi:hypothetical protein